MSQTVKPNQWIKLALELGPLVLFFLANNQGEKLIASVSWLGWSQSR